MGLKELAQLTKELEKCIELLKKEHNRDKRLELFSQFQQIHAQIRLFL